VQSFALSVFLNMTTENFLEKFNSGEIGDDADFIEWFACSDMGTAPNKKIVHHFTSTVDDVYVSV